MEKTKYPFVTFIPILLVPVISFFMMQSHYFSFTVFIIVCCLMMLIATLITLLWGDYLNNKSRSENMGKMNELISGIPDFTPHKVIKAYGNAYLFALDRTRKKIAIVDHRHKLYVFNFKDVIDCELIADGHVIYRESLAIRLGRNHADLIGRMNTIISGDKISNCAKNTVSRFLLVIKVNNPLNPILEYECYNVREATSRTKEEVSIGDRTFQMAKSQAEEVKFLLSIIINENCVDHPVEIGHAMTS